MSTPKHSILPITSDDLPTLAEFLFASKLQLAINRFLFKDWPNEPAQRAIYTGAAEGGFNDPDSASLKVVNDMSGEMVGHLVLTHRKATTGTPATNADANQTQQQNVPNGFKSEVLSTVMKMTEEVDVELKGIEHISSFCLYMFFTHPTNHCNRRNNAHIRATLQSEPGDWLAINTAGH